MIYSENYSCFSYMYYRNAYQTGIFPPYSMSSLHINSTKSMESPYRHISRRYCRISNLAAVQFSWNNLSGLIAGETSMSELLTHANLTSTVSERPGKLDDEGCLRSPQRMPSGLKSFSSVVDAHNVRIDPYLRESVL
jgi:hypothetical protein